MYIPKVFHRIWLGGPMPDEFVKYGESWLKHNPDWDMQLWTEKTIFKFVNQDLIDKSKTLAGKVDIMRYEILQQFGGVYLDTDFECLKPFDDLLEDVPRFYADQIGGQPAIGIMGAIPNDPMFRYIVEQLPDAWHHHSDLTQKSGPIFFGKAVFDWLGIDRKTEHMDPYWFHTTYPDKRVIGFEPKYFYPYGWWEMEKKGNSFPDAYGVHHWAKSWW
jgi:mannosyltransferase OCH1-like enzyme